MSLIIAGLPIVSAFDVRQSIDLIEAKTLLRTLNGTGILQSRWKKLQSTITGSGWLSDGLEAVNTDVAVTVACVASLSVASLTPVITIPRAFRVDSGYAPQGAAIVDGQSVATPVLLAGPVATLTPVAGASLYHVVYCPVINGFITISRQFDDANQAHSWTIEVQEQ